MATLPLCRAFSRSALSRGPTIQQTAPSLQRANKQCPPSRAYRTISQPISSDHSTTQTQTSPPLSLPRSLTLRQHGPVRPASTAAATQPEQPASETPLQPNASLSAQAASRMRKSAAPIAEPYVADGATESLFKECASQADYTIPQAFERRGKIPTGKDGMHIGEGTGWWYENLGLTPTFNTWATITMLHMYLLTVRFRYFSPTYAQIWQQHLNDHFFFEAEHRLTIFHNFYSRAIRNRFLKGLYDQWRGAMGAYDEGLVKGDAVLGAAVWRNVFGGVGGGLSTTSTSTDGKEAEPEEEVDWVKVAIVVSFMRRSLRGLDRAEDGTIVGAMVRFGNPMSERAIVVKESSGLRAPFGKVDDEGWET